MKANDFLLGDYVMYFGKVCVVTHISHCAVVVEEVSGDRDSMLAQPNKLAPIPLTAEMFRENWFEIKNDLSGFLLYFSRSQDGITVHAEENHIGKHPVWHITVDTTYNDKPCVVQIDIDYVHELQHILRLVDAPFEFTL